MDTKDRFCPRNWSGSNEDTMPVSVRWALHYRFNEIAWGKWHYSEGDFTYTACGKMIKPFRVDGSPQEKDVSSVDCRACLKKIAGKRNEGLR